MLDDYCNLSTICALRDFLWRGPVAITLVTVGLFLTIRLKGLQFRLLPRALIMVIKARNKDVSTIPGDISPFQSLMTALAGAIGTGNITGIAAAVAAGGVGALFWMWVIAFIGMASAYSEALLAVKYRQVNKQGAMTGGPMYALLHGLGAGKIAWIYAFCVAIAAMGIGCMVQSNSVAHAVLAVVAIPPWVVGVISAAIIGGVVLGGIKVVGRVAGYLVPGMALLYIISGLIVILFHIENLLPAIKAIMVSAFNGQAAFGAFVGTSWILALQHGVSKGVFSNEAGLGSLAIAAASAKVDHPAEQGLYAIAGVFVSTMLICTITGLAITVSGVMGLADSNGMALKGSQLAMAAFASVHPSLSLVVLCGLALFAFTTILGWGYYGEKCVEFLFGERSAYYYKFVYIAMVIVGTTLKLELVWALSEIANSFMCFPNLVALVGLSGVVVKETKQYLSNLSNKIG